jgi:hypothetical protein
MNLDDDIHNYYEHLVLERIEILELNKLKMKIIWQTYAVLHSIRSQHIRFEVDMSFYLHQSERQKMEMNALNAVSQAISFLDQTELERN